MDELIARVAGAIEVEAEVARLAVGHVVGFLQKEFPEGPAAELLQKMPGVEETIAAAAASSRSGGGAGSGGLAALIGGSGGILGLAGRLGGLGLSTGQMRGLATEVFVYAETVIGEENVEAIKSRIPGLSQFL